VENKKRRLFLSTVLQNDKPLFVAIVLFIAGQIYFTNKGVETFPFLHYGMYSAPAKKSDSLEVVRLIIDKQPVKISSLPDAQKAFVESSFNLYKGLQQNSNYDRIEKVVRQRFYNKLSSEKYNIVLTAIANDSTAIAKYPKWLFQYLADMRLVQNATMQASVVQVRYNSNFYLDSIGGKQIFYYAAE